MNSVQDKNPANPYAAKGYSIWISKDQMVFPQGFEPFWEALNTIFVLYSDSMYGNMQWRSYVINLNRNIGKILCPDYGKYLCRDWNTRQEENDEGEDCATRGKPNCPED